MASRSADLGEHGGWIAVCCAVAAIVFLLPLGLDIPLLDPDEGIVASIAQEMLERGDLVTPRQQGEPFLDKPILYFWAQAASLKLFGMSAAAVRLPGLLLGLCGAVAAGALGWRMFGPAAGYLAGLFYATMILPAALTQIPVHDVALVLFVTAAIAVFWEADRATRSAGWAWIALAGAALGLAMLTKGLVGVALVGVAYGAWLLLYRRLTLEKCLHGAAALAVALLVAGGWYLAMERANPGYLRYFFVERHFLGFATQTQRHADSPWWYYFPILLGGGLPWIGYLPVALRDVYDSRGRLSHARYQSVALLLCWLVGGSLLMMAARSKLVTYVWPVFPPMAILAALGWSRWLEGSLGARARQSLERTFVWSCRLAPAVLPLGIGIAVAILHQPMGLWAWAATLSAGFAAWIPLSLWRGGRRRAAAMAAPLASAVQFFTVLAVVVPVATLHLTARPLAEHYNRLGRMPARLCVFEMEIGSLLFYLDPALRSALKPGQLETIDRDDLERVGPDDVVAISPYVRHLLERRISLEGVPCVEVGGYRLYEPADVVPVLDWLPRRKRDSSLSNQPGSQPKRKKQAPASSPIAAPPTQSLK